MRSRSLFSLPFLVFFALVHTALAKEPLLTISPKTWEVYQGGVVSITVSGKGLRGVKVLDGKREIPLFQRGADGAFGALLGADLEESAGAKKMIIKARGRADADVRVFLHVKKKDYSTERLSLPASFDRFDEATLERIRREKQRMTQLWSTSSGQRWWEAPFVAPVPGAITSPFGLRRVINGSRRSPHSGVDLRAAEGAEIVATNHARVVLVDDFYFNGKSVVLDHGGGLYTMYFHLSGVRVREGSQVRRGEVIGLAGMTGRVTGPHLHWGARLNGARVDPFELLNKVWDKQ